MREKRNCKIIQDLLPNYIEKLTNEETDKFIEEHLNECEECRRTFENMQKEIELSETKRNGKEINYIKKFNRKFVVLRNIVIIVLIILLIYLGSVFRKFFIIKSLQKKVDENARITDYHVTVFYPSGYTEYFRKDDRMVVMGYSRDGSNTSECIIYYKDGKVNTYMEDSDGKRAVLNIKGGEIDSILEYNISNAFVSSYGFIDKENNLELFLLSSRLKIGEGQGGTSVDCYIIDNSAYVMDYDAKYQIFIDKKTGLRMKDSEGYSYKYDFNPVAEVIFEEPDISEYEIITPTWLD